MAKKNLIKKSIFWWIFLFTGTLSLLWILEFLISKISKRKRGVI
ncbi:MAG: hypothetical protein ACTSYR_03450 [Candidatus Odinarchaeia archaeon]